MKTFLHLLKGEVQEINGNGIFQPDPSTLADQINVNERVPEDLDGQSVSRYESMNLGLPDATAGNSHSISGGDPQKIQVYVLSLCCYYQALD